jgi:hypothetical protein
VRAGLGVAVAAGIYEFLSVLFGFFDTPAELVAFGIPQIWIPVILAVLASARNWLKVRKGVSFFGLF